MATHFEETPNEVIISGDENATLAAQRLVIADGGVRVVARGGLLGGSREIDLPYDDIVGVRYQEAITFELVVETADATYQITNVTADRENAETMTRFVDARATGGSAVPSPDEATSQVASDGGDGTTTGDAADGSSRSDSGSTVDGATDVARQLREFARLHEDGIITDEEFARKKRELLEDN